MSLQFSNEDSVRDAIQRELAHEFNFAKRLLDYWLHADKDTGLANSELPHVVLRVLLGMNVKTCRQFRTVCELCCRGEGVDASVIARSMFESVQVIQFVLKPRFTPRRFDNEGNVQSTISVPGRALSREFRATLYVTHHVLEPQREASRHRKRPAMKRFSTRLQKLASRDGITKPYTDAIGPEWTDILLKHPRSYSGLSIADLARSLGAPFPRWYDEVYGHQSQHVHAADLTHHMQLDEEGTTKPVWHESTEQIRGTLLTSIAMFYASIGIMNQRIGFGVSMNTALHGFAREHHQLLHDD